MVGAMLAVSGALLQAALQNPLAEANIIGVSSGALIMRALCMLFIPQLFLLTIIKFYWRFNTIFNNYIVAF